MSSTTYLLERDTPPYLWAGKYEPILKHGGNKFALINELRDMLTGKFKLTLKISEIQANLYVNGKPCLVRKNKFSPITVYKNTKIIKGKDAGQGGSNNYPHISFKGGEAIVEIETVGFPHLELDTYRMKIEILSIEKLCGGNAL